MFENYDTIYLMDMENIGKRYISYFRNVKNAKLIMFLTYAVRGKNLQPQKEANISIERIECKEGYNQLDYQLISYLGYFLNDWKDKKIVIMSSDTGYDVIINEIRKRGYRIFRIGNLEIKKGIYV